MATRTDTPQIAALKKAVEKKFGHVIECRGDFSALAFKIEQSTHEHIAENTLRRIWGKLDGYNTVFTRTLDVLSKYAGYKHWTAFCDNLKSATSSESAVVKGENSIKAEDLRIGERIRIGWMPDRLCVVEYQGGRTFKAIECINSTLQDGDSFECSMMLKNYPLFVDNLVHGGELCQRYSMGLGNGLTTMEKL